jgi:hypothetical protein
MKVVKPHHFEENYWSLFVITNWKRNAGKISIVMRVCRTIKKIKPLI